MNYNSQNLPLSPRKVIKKTIAAYWSVVLISIFLPITYGTLLGSARFGDLDTVAGFVVMEILSFLIIVVGLTYEYFYYRLYHYNFADNEAEIGKGVIERATAHVRYERLQTIYMDQDF